MLLGASDGDTAAPVPESATDSDLLSNLDDGPESSVQGDQVGRERLAGVRTQFISLAARALVQGVQHNIVSLTDRSACT